MTYVRSLAFAYLDSKEYELTEQPIYISYHYTMAFERFFGRHEAQNDL